MTPEEHREDSIKKRRRTRETFESEFNSFLSAVWELGMKPQQVELTLPKEQAILLHQPGIVVKEFWYESDFGLVHITVKE